MNERSVLRPSKLRLVLLLGALAALGPLSIDLYLPAFPALAESLGTDVAAVQLTLATYLAGLASGQLVYGPLADRFGRRKPLLVGLVLYVLASFVCAVAPSLPLLAGARFLQAIGGCAGVVVSRAVVRDLFDARESSEIYSSLMLVMGIAPILAPLLGGWMLQVASWRWMFVVLAGCAFTLALLLASMLPETLPTEGRLRRRPVEILGGVKELLGFGAFMRPAIAGGSMQAAMFAYISGSPFVLIELYGIPPDLYGIAFGANAAGLIFASQLNRWLVPRFGLEHTLRGGIAMGLLGSGVLFFAVVLGIGMWGFLPLLFLAVSVIGVVLPNSTAMAMEPCARQAGLASALLGTLQTLCGALAAAAVSALADGTARPMVGVMLGCGVVAALFIGRPSTLSQGF